MKGGIRQPRDSPASSPAPSLTICASLAFFSSALCCSMRGKAAFRRTTWAAASDSERAAALHLASVARRRMEATSEGAWKFCMHAWGEGGLEFGAAWAIGSGKEAMHGVDVRGCMEGLHSRRWVKSLYACLDSELEHGTGSRRSQKLGDALLGQRGVVGRISQLPRPGYEVVLEARHLKRRLAQLACDRGFSC